MIIILYDSNIESDRFTKIPKQVEPQMNTDEHGWEGVRFDDRGWCS